MAAGAACSHRTARLMLEQGFGHLRASAVSGAQEEHARLPPMRPSIHRRRDYHVEATPSLESRADHRQQVGAATDVDAVIAVAPVGGTASCGDDPCVPQTSQMVRNKILRTADQLR